MKIKIHLLKKLLCFTVLLFFFHNSKAQTSCSTVCRYTFAGIVIDTVNNPTITLCANRQLPFTATFTTCCTSPPHFISSCSNSFATASWNFGDGTGTQYNTTQAVITHSYAATGNYTLTFIGLFGATTKTLSVPVTIVNCCQQSSSTPLFTAGQSEKTPCTNTSTIFDFHPYNSNTTATYPVVGATYSWNFGDGSVSTLQNPGHIYANPGTYTVVGTINIPGCDPASLSMNLNIIICNSLLCDDCLGTFQPSPGTYMVSLWVKEDVTTLPQSYTNPHVEISFTGDPTVYDFHTDGTKDKIIDGWQKIEEQFIIPSGASDIQINLLNASATIDSYYDDIRVYPIDGQMKSYVYDPITLKLTATLDENNYATFYEYDEEGKLIRVKKETEKGIVTIQESREANKKK